MPTSQCAVGALPTPVTIGGTSATSFTAYGLMCGGTTSTGALQSVFSASGGPLLSTGSSSLPAFTPQNATAISLVQTLTASNSSTISFPLTFHGYRIVYSNVYGSGTNLLMQVSTNGGSSYLNTGYQCGYNYIKYNSATWANANSTTFCYVNGSIDVGQTCSGYIDLLQTDTAYAPFRAIGYGSSVSGSSGSFLNTFCTNSATGVNYVQFYMTTGNIVSGTFSLYLLETS